MPLILSDTCHILKVEYLIFPGIFKELLSVNSCFYTAR